MTEPSKNITVHEDSMSPDNWHVVFHAYVDRGGKRYHNGTTDFLNEIDCEGHRHTFDSAGRLWFETVEDAMLYYMRFS
jgi:hypothetical protein